MCSSQNELKLYAVAISGSAALTVFARRRVDPSTAPNGFFDESVHSE